MISDDDLTAADREFLRRAEQMPARAYAELDAHPSMPRTAYARIALAAAKRSQRAKTAKALAWLGVTILALAAIAALPWLLH